MAANIKYSLKNYVKTLGLALNRQLLKAILISLTFKKENDALTSSQLQVKASVDAPCNFSGTSQLKIQVQCLVLK